MGLAAQLPKILLRTQHGVHGPIVGGVIPMVGRSLENRVEIQRRHRQALQIVQLLRNAPEIAAEKVTVTNFPLLVRQIVRGVLPAFVNGPLSHQPLRLRQAAAAEAVWENLVAHTLTEPFRRHGVLIHRQLPGSAASGKGHGLAASSGQGEVVPQQVRLLRGRHRAAPGAAARRQGHRPVKAGELRPEPQHPGADVLLPGAEQGKRHFGAAQNGTEGVFTLLVFGIKINRHIKLLRQVKKASQSSRPQTRKMGTIFHRDMCVGKNTAQQTVNLLPEKPEVFRQSQKTPPLPKRRRRLWRGQVLDISMLV